MEKKILIAFLALALILPMISSQIEVEKTSTDEVMIADLNAPAVFNLEVTNNLDYGQSFTINNLLGFLMEPSDPIFIGKGETKEIELRVYTRENLKYRGFYTLPYIITSSSGKRYDGELNLEIIDFSNALETGSTEFNPESQKVIIYLENKKNVDFDSLDVKFSSAFFTLEKTFSLAPYEKKIFEVELNNEDFNKLYAGFYTLKADINYDEKSTSIEGKMKFNEKDILKTSEENYGFIIDTYITEKKNEGNIIVETSTTLKKNIFSRLFTTFSSEPDSVQRDGFEILYTWERDLKPGETLKVVVKTNWIFPLLVIIFVVVIVYLAKQLKRTDLELKKRINFVRAKGGEFALKITISARAKNYIENVKVYDKLPMLTKIHERYGGELPSRVDERSRKIEWSFSRLEEGEIRSMSYIIYSKIGVLGRFALPATRATYEREGKLKESESNRAFFVTEQKGAVEE